MDEQEQELIFNKTKVLFENRFPIHVKLKNGGWLNGEIVKEFNSDFFMLKERKLGLMPVFFLEIKEIDKLEEKK